MVPDDELDIELRHPQVVAERLVALTTVSNRASIEYEIGTHPNESQYELETERFDLYSWGKKELFNFLMPDELAFLKTSFGKVEITILDEFIHATDAALALAWSLGILKTRHLAIPSSKDFAVQVSSLQQWAPDPWDKPQRLFRNLALRPEESIWAERERFSIARLWWLASSLDTPEGKDLLIDIRQQTGAPEGTPFQDVLLAPDQIRTLKDDKRTIIIESLGHTTKALSWVCGLGDGWNDVPWDDLGNSLTL